LWRPPAQLVREAHLTTAHEIGCIPRYRGTVINGEIANFSHPCVFNVPLRESPWNFVTAVALEKLSVVPLPDGGKTGDMSIRLRTVPYVTDIALCILCNNKKLCCC